VRRTSEPTGASKLAQELHDEFPDTPTLTLARRFYKENPGLFSTLEAARNTLRYVRGTKGVANRAKRGLKEPLRVAQSGMLPSLPPSESKPWVPVVLDMPCRVLSLSDAHIPYHDHKAIEAAVTFGKALNPDVLLLNGDWCDFYSLSRWDRDPKLRNFVAEIDKIEQSLEWLQSEFPKARKILKYGNHEERYNTFIWQKAPELWGVDACQLPELLHLADYGFEYVDNERPILAGHLPIFHGHELPKGMTNPVGPARTAYMKLGGTSLTGHHHRVNVYTKPNWKHEEVTCWSQGCLCDRSPKYARINEWTLGFAFITVVQAARRNELA